jgi:hypothetical protein
MSNFDRYVGRRLINDVVTETPESLQDSASEDEKFDSNSEMMEEDQV